MDEKVINGVRVAHRTAGEQGARPVVLIHGFTGNTRNWALAIKPLVAAGWRTLSADGPGHGYSSAPEDAGCYRIPAMADLHHQLAVETGFAPAVVVGHSMGGAIAEEYAIRHPEAVEALVLVDSAGGGPRTDDTSRIFGNLDQARKLANEKGTAALFDWQLDRGMRPEFEKLTPEQQALTRSEFALTSPAGWVNCAAGMRDRRFTLEDLGGLGKPALVIRGVNEGAGLVEASDGLAAAIPGARYEVIVGAGHSPQIENPAAFSEVLLAFLGSLPARG